MEDRIKLIKLKTTFQAVVKVFDGLGFQGLPFLIELLQPLLSLGLSGSFENIVSLHGDLSLAQPLGLSFG